MDDVARKLAAARTRLILDNPFLGALVLRLPLESADPGWCPTTATDARALYFNHEFIAGLSLGQVQFVLAHEALHCGLSHFARREHRDRRRWDVACDYAVNQLLEIDGLEQPPGTLLDAAFDGMTAEEIYPCIDKDDDQQPMDQHLYDGPRDADNNDDASGEDTRDGDADGSDASDSPESAEDEPGDGGQGFADATQKPQPLTEAEQDQLDTQWQQRLAGAAQQAMAAGKLKGNAARMVERLLRPSVPWRSLLARHMSSSARTDYNIMRPSQRREGDAILPSLYARQINIVVALDTSGSVKSEEFDLFLAEVNAIKGSLNARITMLACDSELDENCPWHFETWEAMHLPAQIRGGGGTDFRPVFDWLDANSVTQDLLIYFTDARGRFPERPPAVTTLWLVKGGESIPFGQRIQLN